MRIPLDLTPGDWTVLTELLGEEVRRAPAERHLPNEGEALDRLDAAFARADDALAESGAFESQAPPTMSAKGDEIYAVDEHDRPDLPWPVPATHWFWQHGDRWVAVVGDWHEDWWEGSDPADIAARPDPWRYPINETPGRSGLLVYLDAEGNEQSHRLTVHPPSA